MRAESTEFRPCDQLDMPPSSAITRRKKRGFGVSMATPRITLSLPKGLLVNVLKLTCIAAALLGSIRICWADEPPKATSLDAANRLFRQGKFNEAEPLYLQVRKEQSAKFDASMRLGDIALFRNDLDKAEQYFADAILLKPKDLEANKAVFYVFYRRDDFAIAGAILRSLADEAGGKKLESFKGQRAYQIEGKSDVTRVPFLVTDPLPLIEVKIGDETAHFMIDTGGPRAVH